jgi:N-acetyl sugar amidotransferase
MEKILRPALVDLSLYAPDAAPSTTKYGLPREVTFCRKCVMSNQKPNSEKEYTHNAQTKKATLNIDETGVCSACRNSEKKDQGINWKQREEELLELLARYRSKDGSYDCLVPGSGGKDSFFTAHVLKYKYGMHPLTVTWTPHLYTTWGRKNFEAWINAGFDNYLFSPNGRTHRLLTRLAIETIFHPFQPFMLGQMYYAPRIAAKLGIPLVFYGENAAEYGNPIEENSRAEKDWEYFTAPDQSKIHLGGVSVADLQNQFGLLPGDLAPFMPPNPADLRKAEVRVRYLGYYVKWHPQGTFYYSMEHGGFEPAPERTVGTYSKYNSIDDKIDDFHYYTTYVKFGIGRASYDASQEIRNGELEREEGVALVQRFDGEYPERFAEEIFRYLSIPEKEFPVASRMFEQPIVDREYFAAMCDKFRSPHLWQKEGGRWSLRHAVWRP